MNININEIINILSFFIGIPTIIGTAVGVGKILQRLTNLEENTDNTNPRVSKLEINHSATKTRVKRNEGDITDLKKIIDVR